MFCRNFLSSKGFPKSFLLCFVNPNIIAMLTTISPVSHKVSIQRTPGLVIHRFGTGMVCYSIECERYTATLASRCLVETLRFCEDVLNTQMKGTTKYNVTLAVYKFLKKQYGHNNISYYFNNLKMLRYQLLSKWTIKLFINPTKNLRCDV